MDDNDRGVSRVLLSAAMVQSVGGEDDKAKAKGKHENDRRGGGEEVPGVE